MDLQLLADEVDQLPRDAVPVYQELMMKARSQYEELIETAEIEDPATLEATKLYEQAITLIDHVLTKLRTRKGVLSHGNGR